MENFTSSLKALRRRWMKRSIIAVLLLILVALAPYIFARLTRHSLALEKTEVQTVSIESTEDAAIRVGAYNIATRSRRKGGPIELDRPEPGGVGIAPDRSCGTGAERRDQYPCIE